MGLSAELKERMFGGLNAFRAGQAGAAQLATPESQQRQEALARHALATSLETPHVVTGMGAGLAMLAGEGEAVTRGLKTRDPGAFTRGYEAGYHALPYSEEVERGYEASLERLEESGIDPGGVLGLEMFVPGPLGPLAKLGKLGALAGKAGGLSPELAAIYGLFHGSRHDLGPEYVFKHNRIGTGEGAMMLGPGPNIAQARGTSESYMTAGAGPQQLGMVGGRAYDALDPEHYAARLRHDNPDMSREQLRTRMEDMKTAMIGDPETPEADIYAMHDAIEVMGSERELLAFVPTPKRGYLYQLDLPDHDPEDFMHLDQRIGEQARVIERIRQLPEAQQRAIEGEAKYWLKDSTVTLEDLTGWEMMDAMRRALPRATPEEVFKRTGLRLSPAQDHELTHMAMRFALEDAGVAGTRSLDQFSRELGEGTENYVLFQQGIEDITHVNDVLLQREQAPIVRGLKEPRRGGLRQPLKVQRGQQPYKNVEEGLELRDLSHEDALARARTGRHLRYRKDGSSIGGPPGVTDAKTLKAARKKYDDYVEKGAEQGGADWYERFRESMTRMGGARAGTAARVMGATSPQRAPRTNLGAGTRALNAMMHGEPVGGMTGPVAREAERVARTGDYPGGLKTGTYAQAGDPSAAYPVNPVNDRHQLTAWGYNTKVADAPKHVWLDAETLLAMERANAKGLGGRTDWTVEEIQASAWVSRNAESLMDTKTSGVTNWADAYERSVAEYRPHFREHTMDVPSEFVEGAAWRTRPGGEQLPPMTPDEIPEYHARMTEAFETAEGRNPILEGAGFYAEPGVPMQGTWKEGEEMVFNPGRVDRPFVDITTQEMGRYPSPRDQEAIGGLAELQAIATKQEGIGGLYTYSPKHPDYARGALVRGDFSNEQVQQIAREADEAGFPIVQHRPDEGVLAARFEGEERFTPTAELGALASRDVEHVGVAGPYAEPAITAEGAGTATRQLADKLEKFPVMLERLELDPNFHEAMLKTMHVWKEAGRLPSDLENFLTLAAEPGGLTKLFESARDGGYLPALLAGSIAGGYVLDEQGS